MRSKQLASAWKHAGKVAMREEAHCRGPGVDVIQGAAAPGTVLIWRPQKELLSKHRADRDALAA